MLHYIKGKVAETFPGMIILDNNGLGYEINVPENCLALNSKENVTLYTAMIVKEDDISLYGFDDEESLFLFKLLITVSGVGAKAALAMLSVLPPIQLKRAIVQENAAAITKANGVGKKIAQRVILELKEKIKQLGISEEAGDAPLPKRSDAKNQAQKALVSLGYSNQEAFDALKDIEEENFSTEEYIRAALRKRR